MSKDEVLARKDGGGTETHGQIQLEDVYIREMQGRFKRETFGRECDCGI